MTDRRNDGAKPSTLERALGIFAKVKSGEGPTALLLSFGLFLLLAAYYVIKPVRDSLITGVENGAKYKSYMGAAIAVSLLFAVPAYGSFAARLPRNKLLIGVSAFFISNLVIFFFAGLIPGTQTGTGQLVYALVFFLWVGIFNMMIIAQFWAFANDLYTEEQGKRLFALVGLGASVGSAAGSFVTSFAKKFGTQSMLLVCAVLLALSAAITVVVNAREAKRLEKREKALDAARAASPAPDAEAESKAGGFSMVLSHRYLLLIAAFTVVFTLVNTNGEYVKDELIARLAADQGALQGLDAAQIKDLRTQLFSEFYGWVNVLGVVLQSFVVSRIVAWLGLKRAFFILPAIAFLDAGAIALMPVWSFIQYGKIGENAVDYSLNNTLRNMLWLPTTRRMKYLAKQAIDTFFVRLGDVTSALCVFVFADRLKLSVRSFGIMNLALVGVWLVLARAIGSENQKMSAKNAAEKREEAGGEAGDAPA